MENTEIKNETVEETEEIKKEENTEEISAPATEETAAEESEEKETEESVAEETEADTTTEESEEKTSGDEETLMMEQLTDVGMEEGKKEKKKPINILQELFTFARDLIICFIGVLLVTTFLVKPVRVRGSSMYPTLQDGALAFSNIIGCKQGNIKRFDVAIVYVEEKDEYLVKRVIGLPNETIRYEDGVLYVNGEAVEEDFIDEEYRQPYGDRFMDDVQEITLGEDEFYCLGDNRPNSLDSRYYGPFKGSLITAKGIAVFYPFDNAGIKTW